jgi:metacaspase-1
MPSKALCVGINLFKNYPSATLQGCVPDAHEMANVLTEFLGFKKSDITLLTDAQATKSNIMTNLKEMVDGARTGKYGYLVFSISSHGSQVPDISGDEPDHADEVFCPHDLAQAGNQWDPKYIISDDELHELFVKLQPNVRLEAFADTCHSGTSLKALDLLMDRKPRFLPPPSLEAFQKVEGLAPHGFYKKLLKSAATHYILWTACRDNQTSADAHIHGSWHGAFTYYFCKEIRTCKNTMSCAKLLAKVRADLAKASYSQIPQLECQATVRNLQIRPAQAPKATAA